jgi:hypothetical protein
MDYGFAPGGTRFDVAARNYFDWRTGSNSVFALDPTIESYVMELTTSAFVNRPVGNLGIGCHGHWTGFLDISLDSTSGPRAMFEQVVRADIGGTIRIPSTALDPRPTFGGLPVKAIFRIIGCEIGVAEPYLAKLRDALGDVMIIATQHIDSVNPAELGDVKGLLRMLIYDFRVLRANALATKAEVVQAFVDAKHKWYDGTDVPRKIWEEDVPTGVTSVGEVAKPQPIELSPPFNWQKYTAPPARVWMHEHEPVGPFPVIPPTLMSPSPASRAFMRQQLIGLPSMQLVHFFPLYKQRGYASFDDFMDGYEWMPINKAGALWAGFRHVYHVRRVITEAANSLIFLHEFVTPSGADQRLGLPETDPRYFTIV